MSRSRNPRKWRSVPVGSLCTNDRYWLLMLSDHMYLHFSILHNATLHSLVAGLDDPMGSWEVVYEPSS